MPGTGRGWRVSAVRPPFADEYGSLPRAVRPLIEVTVTIDGLRELLTQERDRGTTHPRHADQVELQQGRPDLITSFLEHAVWKVSSSDVDHDVQTTKLIRDPGDRAVYGDPVRHVHPERHRTQSTRPGHRRLSEPGPGRGRLTATRAPSAASRAAHARPIPCPAPVTRTVAPPKRPDSIIAALPSSSKRPPSRVEDGFVLADDPGRHLHRRGSSGGCWDRSRSQPAAEPPSGRGSASEHHGLVCAWREGLAVVDDNPVTGAEVRARRDVVCPAPSPQWRGPGRAR